MDGRTAYYRERLESAPDASGRFAVLQGRVLSDIGRLPRDVQPGAWQVAAEALEKVLDTLREALGVDDATDFMEGGEHHV